MKVIKIQIFVGMLMLLIMIFSGCTEQINNKPNGDGNGTTNSNEFRMNTIQLLDDIDVQTDYASYMTMDYKSMEEGDTLIFMDTISSVRYINDVNATEIAFKITVGETGWKSTQFYFIGNITNSYSAGDFVKIKVTIKHVTLPDIQGMNLDIEIYEQAWRSEEYFRDNIATSIGGFYPMPIDTIIKI